MPKTTTKKKVVVYSETYTKPGVPCDNKSISELTKNEDSELLCEKAGKYDDGTEFMILRINFKP